MKTIETAMWGLLPISLVSDSEERKFNIQIIYKDGEKLLKEWYHFPTMVSEKKAREEYNQYLEN